MHSECLHPLEKPIRPRPEIILLNIIHNRIAYLAKGQSSAKHTSQYGLPCVGASVQGCFQYYLRESLLSTNLYHIQLACYNVDTKTNVLVKSRCNMAENWDSRTNSPEGGEKQKRRIRFLPLPTTPKVELSFKQDKVWSPVRGLRVRTSLWLWLAIICLFISNILYAVAFLTNGWGILVVDPNNKGPELPPGATTPVYSQEGVIPPNKNVFFNPDSSGKDLFAEGEKYWEFGLWECCRNDGFCLGTRWPAFYSATRAFAVLGLFGQILTLAWLTGHALENLLEYDPCTVVALIALNISSALFVLLSVVCFGTRWPVEFSQDFNGHATSLSYSFYLAVTTVVLLTASSILSIIDFVVTLRSLAMFDRQSWVTADELLGDEDEVDNIEDKSYNRITQM